MIPVSSGYVPFPSTGGRVDLPEHYAVAKGRQNVKDALMSHGEECIVVAVYHVTRDLGTVPRCVNFNDAYEQDPRHSCTLCYGTTMRGGVMGAWRQWGLFTDTLNKTDETKRGEYHPATRQFQTEWWPEALTEDDYVIRVGRWTPDHRPESVEGIYGLQDVISESVRTTGFIPGQNESDIIGNRCTIDRVDESHPIYQYPVIGRVFDRWDGKAR